MPFHGTSSRSAEVEEDKNLLRQEGGHGISSLKSTRVLSHGQLLHGGLQPSGAKWRLVAQWNEWGGYLAKVG